MQERGFDIEAHDKFRKLAPISHERISRKPFTAYYQVKCPEDNRLYDVNYKKSCGGCGNVII